VRSLLAHAALACAGAVAAQPLPAQRETRHALIIAIGDYADPAIEPLPGVVHDVDSARRMARAMAVADGNITELRDRQATAAGIRDALTALQARLRDGDRVFVYYSGHGTRWFDPALPAGGCAEGLLAADGQVLGNSELGERLAPLARRADKMLVFYDACFSGGLASAAARTRGLRPGAAVVTPKFSSAGSPQACAQPSNYRTRSLAQTLQQAQALPQNVVHVAASRPDELSFDSSTQGGYATAAWRDCLLGEARDLDGSGAITVQEVTQCAQAKLTQALAGQPGISGQQMTLAGNAAFVPAWMGAAYAPPTATASLAASPAEILAELHGQRDGRRHVAASVRQAVLKIGVDALQLDITPARDGWLYIAQAGSDGRSLYLLYPNQLAADNRVRAGQTLSLPGKSWEIVAGGPPGPETLLVMVTDAPRDLASLPVESAGPFMKTLLDGQGRARLQALLAGGTPAAGCGQAGGPACSDAYGSALLRVETVR
jgi:hypothetical protein